MSLANIQMRWVFPMMLLLLANLLIASSALADTTPTPTTPPAGKEVCTDFAKLKISAEDGTPGILTNIMNFIKPIVSNASRDLFQAFTSSSSYQAAVNGAITLMLVIYGVGFTIGVVQPSFGQLLIRLVKVGIIYAVISPDGWAFFSQYAVKFFNDGTDELIGGVMSIGSGIDYAAGDSPFKALDGIAKSTINPDMIIAVIGATFDNGPYGLLIGSMLGFATAGLLKMMLEALKNYAVSFIVRAMLLGVAPVFLVFLLFDKTKQLFTGWLNSLINLSIKPILYFTFLSFFMVMMAGASKDMMGGNELCWVEFKNVPGAANKMSGWRFKAPGANSPSLDDMDWGGSISCRLRGEKNCPEFPVNILDILSFLILVYVAQRFSSVVDNLANEISSAYVNLSLDAKHDQRDLQPHTATASANQPAAGQQPRASTKPAGKH